MLTQDEKRVLFTHDPVPIYDAVTVIRLPSGLLEWFWARTAATVCIPDRATPEQRQTALWEFAHEVSGALESASAILTTRLRSCDVQVTPTGSRSTGYDYRAGRYVGLHIDNHDRLPLGERRNAFQVLGLNLGSAERHLLIVNLAVPELLARIGSDLDDGEERYRQISRLTTDFFRSNPHYPVVRVTLPPGTAYILVTQYVIHDGGANTSGQPDVAFLLGGHFAFPAHHHL